MFTLGGSQMLKFPLGWTPRLFSNPQCSLGTPYLTPRAKSQPLSCQNIPRSLWNTLCPRLAPGLSPPQCSQPLSFLPTPPTTSLTPQMAVSCTLTFCCIMQWLSKWAVASERAELESQFSHFHVTLGKLFNLSKPQFPLPLNKDDNDNKIDLILIFFFKANTPL